MKYLEEPLSPNLTNSAGFSAFWIVTRSPVSRKTILTIDGQHYWLTSTIQTHLDLYSGLVTTERAAESGQMGVMQMEFRRGSMMGPPAAKE